MPGLMAVVDMEHRAHSVWRPLADGAYAALPREHRVIVFKSQPKVAPQVEGPVQPLAPVRCEIRLLRRLAVRGGQVFVFAHPVGSLRLLS
jgi:hypothetical protein